MQREILFRGKRLDNGEWAYGCFATIQKKEHYILVPSPLGLLWQEVIPETVGQFTGFKDKNNNNVFEGDLVSFAKNEHEIRYFDNHGMFAMVGKNNYATNNIDESKPMGSTGSSTKYKPYVLNDYYQKRIEVIGNIHDKNKTS